MTWRLPSSTLGTLTVTVRTTGDRLSILGNLLGKALRSYHWALLNNGPLVAPPTLSKLLGPGHLLKDTTPCLFPLPGMNSLKSPARLQTSSLIITGSNHLFTKPLSRERLVHCMNRVKEKAAVCSHELTLAMAVPAGQTGKSESTGQACLTSAVATLETTAT